MRLLLRTDGLEQGPIVPWKQVQAALKVIAVLLSCFAMQQDDPRQLLPLELEALVSMRGIHFQQRLLCGVIIRSMPCAALPCNAMQCHASAVSIKGSFCESSRTINDQLKH